MFLPKYSLVKLLKDKKAKILLHGFIGIVNESRRKPNKLWVGQGREFYNNLMKKRLNNDNILMYSAHNEGN